MDSIPKFSSHFSPLFAPYLSKPILLNSPLPTRYLHFSVAIFHL